MQLGEMWRLAQAIGRTLADSEQTGEIQVAEELTGRGKYRAWIAAHRNDPEVLALLEDRPELCSEQVDYDALRALPADTLGNRYVRHLDDNGLSADSQATATQYIDDPDMAYLMRRFRQTHDVWHALIELGTAGHEEVIIHAFSYGQLRLPVSALVVFFGSIKHIVLERRWGALRHALAEAYVIGRDAAPLLPVYWERMWETPMDEIRARYHLRPCTAGFVAG